MRISLSAEARDARKMGSEAGPDDRPVRDRKKDQAFQHPWEEWCLEAEQHDPDFAARMLDLGRHISRPARGLSSIRCSTADSQFPGTSGLRLCGG